MRFFEVSPEDKDYLRVISEAQSEFENMHGSVDAAQSQGGMIGDTRRYAAFLLLMKI